MPSAPLWLNDRFGNCLTIMQNGLKMRSKAKKQKHRAKRGAQCFCCQLTLLVQLKAIDSNVFVIWCSAFNHASYEYGGWFGHVDTENVSQSPSNFQSALSHNKCRVACFGSLIFTRYRPIWGIWNMRMNNLRLLRNSYPRDTNLGWGLDTLSMKCWLSLSIANWFNEFC